MKKTISILILCFILSASVALAQGNSGQDNSNSPAAQQTSVQNQNQEQNQNQNQGENQNQEQEQIQVQNSAGTIGIQLQEQVRARNTNELRTMIQAQEQEMNQEIEEMEDEDQQAVFKNQNKVREAVHALLAAEDLVGGIGQQVSAVAIEFNNSVEKTIQAEERIQKRSGFVKFFLGGDKKAAQEIEQEVNQNQVRLQELKQLHQQCPCLSTVKEIIQAQIQNIEQEQNRLQELALEQINKKGVFSWLFGWLDNIVG